MRATVLPSSVRKSLYWNWNALKVVFSRCCHSHKNHESEVKLLKISQNRNVAYRKTHGKHPGIIFLPGYMSDMTGNKAIALEKYCAERGRSFVRFDYEGIGCSPGDINTATFSMWKEDALTVLDQLTQKTQILVGSSTGGWFMFHLAMERIHRVHALVGISTACDWPSLRLATDQYQEMFKKDGQVDFDEQLFITQKAYEDSKKLNILDKLNLIPLKNIPVRLLHGMKDETVPYMNSVKLSEKLQCTDVEVRLLNNTEHRFSEEKDLTTIIDTVNKILE